ncbi:hypothetical protein FDECE_12299 [Fusarium decemcellulare]|nr:hypothetical protein FDECE_12299 [Fusarium decemcellulare]
MQSEAPAAGLNHSGLCLYSLAFRCSDFCRLEANENAHHLGWAGAPSALVRRYPNPYSCPPRSEFELTRQIAGGGAYYFAKQQINADRQAKIEAHRRKKQMIESLEVQQGNGSPARTDSTGSPSQEASNDPAPTRHAPETEAQRVDEKSKYESSTVYRSPKGDRFS